MQILYETRCFYTHSVRCLNTRSEEGKEWQRQEYYRSFWQPCCLFARTQLYSLRQETEDNQETEDHQEAEGQPETGDQLETGDQQKTEDQPIEVAETAEQPVTAEQSETTAQQTGAEHLDETAADEPAPTNVPAQTPSSSVEEHHLAFASDYHNTEGSIRNAMEGLPEDVEYVSLIGREARKNESCRKKRS